MDTHIISGTVEHKIDLVPSRLQLSIGFPGNEACDKNVVITREAIQHISSSGQYKKLPKLIMEYFPTHMVFENDVMYVKELKIVGFHLEDNDNEQHE
jgi:hypothetical protein